MPKVWIGTSWKMNKTLAEALSWANGLASADLSPAVQTFVIPPFTAARQVKEALAKTSVLVGAQNMHWAAQGAWTGEISAPMLVDCGLDIVELGHSERREHFGETDETVGRKAEAAIRHGLIPLICIGETQEDRAQGKTAEILAQQVRGSLSKLTDEQKQSEIWFAYEPVWAIGEAGIPATPDDADARQAEIIKVAEKVLGRRVPCLYGGSVNPGNCAELITCPHVDGLFVGRSAWDVDGYLEILKRCDTALNAQVNME